MKARIDRKDLAHLNAFPGEEKAKIMRKIMSINPVELVVLEGATDFEKALLKLRREGFGLIDLQRQELSFSCTWHRRTKALFNGGGADITMLFWELQERGAETTILTWRL